MSTTAGMATAAGITTVEQARAQVRQVLADVGRIVAPNGVEWDGLVRLGGVDQWVGMRGQDAANPVLLFLHGGPGSPVSDIAWAYQRPWEDFFTVVHWDQRGFGRSFDTADAEQLRGTLHRAQLVADTVELVEHLCARFGQQRVVLVGQSWGTVLALEVARARPDLLHVVVAQGLAVNWLASPELLRQDLVRRALQSGDHAEAQRLTDLGPPPVEQGVEAVLDWPRALGVPFPDEATWHNIAGEGDGWPRRIETLRWMSPDVDPQRVAREQELEADPDGELRRRYREAMASALDWDAYQHVGTRFDVPLVVMMGSHDRQTHIDLARDYYAAVHAPYKVWVELPHAAHALNIEQPGLALQGLLAAALPAVHGRVPVDAEIGAPA